MPSLFSSLHMLSFNPRLREGGDNTVSPPVLSTNSFNPRLREGGDTASAIADAVLDVSIHASAREATPAGWTSDQFAPVSIHASAREATKVPDLAATGSEFQSTPPRGRRPVTASMLTSHIMFQSTPPRGRRLHRWIVPSVLSGFNPRLREGGDCDGVMAWGCVLGFNPRLREGGDSPDRRLPARVALFQSTPPRGRRHDWQSEKELTQCFNPRLREGGDIVAVAILQA